MGNELNTTRGGASALRYTNFSRPGPRELNLPMRLRDQYLFQRRAVRGDHPIVALRNGHTSGPWGKDSIY